MIVLKVFGIAFGIAFGIGLAIFVIFMLFIGTEELFS